VTEKVGEHSGCPDQLAHHYPPHWYSTDRTHIRHLAHCCHLQDYALVACYLI
jgi:hypothetical protein